MDLVGLLKSQFLCHLVFCYVFIASGLLVNAVQLCTLLLWPINKQLFRRINCRLSYCVSSRKTCPPPAPCSRLPARETRLAGLSVPATLLCVWLLSAFCWKCLFLSSLFEKRALNAECQEREIQ